jgi:serine/threonine-protein kinase HipA
LKICPITYEEIPARTKYSERGLRSLSPSLKRLNDLPYSAEEQRREAEAHAGKLSIQGVQPKLSAVLNVKNSSFDLIDKGGRYILKPQVERFKQLPENEDLTMRLAAIVGIEAPRHGLVYSRDGSLTYFIRRFDRKGQKDKVHVEDFAQLSGASRDTKYDSSMERVAEVLEELCTFPAVEKLKLYQRTVFSFLIGNEDLHLKNFSLIVRDDKVELSPAYDLVNSTIVLASPTVELALPVRGRRNKLKRSDLVDYFGMERLKLTSSVCEAFLVQLRSALPAWDSLIERSFLSPDARKRYREVIKDRAGRLAVH